MAGAHRRPSAKPRRITLLVLLCAAVVTAGWLVLPTQPQQADRPSHTSAPGAGAGDGTLDDYRSERGSRRQRETVKPSPAKSRLVKPSPSPSRTVPKLTGDAALEAKVVELANLQRARAGCGALRYDERLRTAARTHSTDMARHERLDHTGTDGSSFTDRAARAGYQDAMGENIAMGYGTPQEVTDAWMKSKGHRDNILNCDARAMGVGLARTADGTPYWTQVFGRA